MVQRAFVTECYKALAVALQTQREEGGGELAIPRQFVVGRYFASFLVFASAAFLAASRLSASALLQ